MRSNIQKHVESILLDLAISQLEPSIDIGRYARSSLDKVQTNGNSHTYRTDKPLINDIKTYDRFLAEVNALLKRNLNERQYIAVILYFSHAKTTQQNVSDLMKYNRDSISNAIVKARRLIKEIL